MRHGPFKITKAGRDRWVKLMTEAVAEAGIPAEAATVLAAFFQNTATFLINSGEEEGGAGFAGNRIFPVTE